jgi:MFS family permease
VSEAPDELPVPSAWRLLRRPSFARYIAGNFISNLGNWFQDIAAAILLYQLTGSAVFVAFVTVASYGTSLVLSPLGGQLADRFDRRRLLITTHLAQGAAAAVLAVLVFGSGATPWLVFGFSLVIGVGRAINNPTLQAMLPNMVLPHELGPANALQSLTFNLARAVGPVLGAVLVTTAGPAMAFALNAVTFLVFAVVLRTIDVPRVRVSPAPGADVGVLGGLRYVRARPGLALLLVFSAVVGMSTDPVITLGPALAASFGQEEGWAGWLVAAFGAGAVCAAPFAGSLRHRVGRVRTAGVALAVVALGIAAMAFAPSAALVLVFAAVAGGAFLTGSTDVTTTIQETIRDEVRGRVMALWSMGFLGSRPLAALVDGVISDLWSPYAALMCMALLLAGASVGMLALRPRLRWGASEA